MATKAKTKTTEVTERVEETKVATPTETSAEVVTKANEFTRTTTAEELANHKTKLENASSELSVALMGDDMKLIDEKQKAVDEAVEGYNGYKTRYEYENYLESENPAYEALKAGYIDLAKVTLKKELGVTKAEVKYAPVQIDFVAFDATSKYRIFGAKLGTQAQQCGYIAALLKGVASGKSVEDVTKAYKASGKRAIVKVITEEPKLAMLKDALQDLVDELLFIDNGKGKNKFMVSSHWAHFFLDCIATSKYGKGELSVNVYGVKRIIAAAAGMYHAALNEYGITLNIDDQKC